MKKIIAQAITSFLFFLFVSSVLAQETEIHTMRIAIGNPPNTNNFGWTPFVVLQEELQELSSGRLRVELSSQVLGKSSLEMIEMVRHGVVDARDFADGHLATIYPPIQVLSIPYLFLEREIAWKVLDGPFGQRLIDDMAKTTGLRPLYWIENGGFRHFSNNVRPIHSPIDMHGLKIRTMESPLHLKIVLDLGARGVPVTWSNVYETIESGIVDGQENSISTFMIPHFENIQNHIILDGHIYGTYTLLMNNSWYQSLPPDLREILHRAGRLSAAVNRGLSIANEIEGIGYLKSKNVEIYRPSIAEKEDFRNATQASAITWLREHVGDQWVESVLQATAEAEKELKYQK